MRGKAHLACGIIAGAGVSFALRQPLLPSVLIISASAFASLLPDIDHPQSTLGHYIKPIAKFLKNHFGHRTVTHSGFWLVPLIVLCFSFNNTEYFPIFLGLTVGLLSHLISDSLTMGGVPWFYPLKRKRYGFTRIKSGDKDWLLAGIADMLIIGLAFLISSQQIQDIITKFKI